MKRIAVVMIALWGAAALVFFGQPVRGLDHQWASTTRIGPDLRVSRDGAHHVPEAEVVLPNGRRHVFSVTDGQALRRVERICLHSTVGRV